MVVAFDSGMLLLYLDPESRPPSFNDADGNIVPLPDAHDRVSHLVARLEKARATILVPTPVYSEILVGAGSARDEWLSVMERSARIDVVPFCKVSAIELSEVERMAKINGDKRGPTPHASWQKVKFDRQIVMIARVYGAEAIYGNDDDIRKHATAFDLPYYDCRDLEKPPVDAQGELQLDQDESSVTESDDSRDVDENAVAADPGEAEQAASADDEDDDAREEEEPEASEEPGTQSGDEHPSGG